MGFESTTSWLRYRSGCWCFVKNIQCILCNSGQEYHRVECCYIEQSRYIDIHGSVHTAASANQNWWTWTSRFQYTFLRPVFFNRGLSRPLSGELQIQSSGVESKLVESTFLFGGELGPKEIGANAYALSVRSHSSRRTYPPKRWFISMKYMKYKADIYGDPGVSPSIDGNNNNNCPRRRRGKWAVLQFQRVSRRSIETFDASSKWILKFKVLF